jgi:hypothetical protein
MLFPPETIKMDDPHAGDKVIWNLRAATYGATMDLRDIAWAFLDAKKGYERVQAFQSRRYYMEGRLDGGPITVGKGDISQKTYFVATYPQDIRGLGLFSVRYNQADLEGAGRLLRLPEVGAPRAPPVRRRVDGPDRRYRPAVRRLGHLGCRADQVRVQQADREALGAGHRAQPGNERGREAALHRPGQALPAHRHRHSAALQPGAGHRLGAA